jgi:hypothetical protein
MARTKTFSMTGLRKELRGPILERGGDAPREVAARPCSSGNTSIGSIDWRQSSADEDTWGGEPCKWIG